MIPAEVQERGPEAVAIYKQSIADGSDERFATMCALRQPPGSRNTDRAFCEGARRQMDGMNDDNRKKLMQVARAAGINPNGKFYKGSLGRANDPAAWVTCADDVLAVCKARNYGCDGVIKHTAVQKDTPPKRVPLGEDIIKRRALEIMKAEPQTAAAMKKNPQKTKAALRERIIAKHGKR